MNCEVLQRHLLGSESPDRPSSAAATHLAACAACREWLQRLLQLEGALPLLPVPPAEAARSALLRRILTEQAAANGEAAGDKPQPTRERRRRSVAMVLGSWILDPHASPRRRVAAGLVAGVAAALLLFVTGGLIYLADHPQPQNDGPVKVPVDSLAQELRRYRVPLGDLKEPRDRVNTMADAAEELSRRAAGQRRPDDELIALAQLYGRVVDEGIVKTAEGLSAEERREVLEPICKSLEKAQSEWDGMASQQMGLSPRVQDALKKAALAAETGNKRLRELCAA